MKHKAIALALLVVMLASTITFADDGIVYRRDVSKTPLAETEKSAVYMMDFYVPAQDSTGLVAPVDDYYLAVDENGNECDPQNPESCTAAFEPRNYAKPLFSVYIDDIGHEPIESGLIGGGITFGHFDAFVAYSLDDGDSWRAENASRSSDLSSFTLANGHAYPGDVHHVVHQVAEDKVLLVWASKYCQSGNPLYAIVPEDELDYLADLETTWGKNALFLYDFFGVAGNQGSVDYTEQGFPEIGEIPYSCIWTQRGKLLPGDDPMTAENIEATHVVWAKPERLTSGVRDANLPAVDCAGGAGCALTWQEDPEGLRPGKGLGPGEGWSGAIANAKTDIWYSYVTFADFDYVVNDTDGDGLADPGEAMLIEEYEALKGAEMDQPKPYVPMAIPVRLTDNDMCKATAGTNGKPEDPFCWVDFDTIDDLNNTNITSFFDNLLAPETDADFCATSVAWTNPGGTTLDICVTEDGRWMIGRVASTRVRMIIKPYLPAEAPDNDLDGVLDKSAWLSLAAEETKALGITGDFDGDGDGEYDPVDIGKDMFYYSFDYAKPYNLHVNLALDAVDDSAFIVQQGGMLNQPAKCSPYFITTPDTNPLATCPADGEFFDIQVDPITGYEYYLTEISRRFALTLNNPGNIVTTDASGNVIPAPNNQSGLAGVLIYKQGIIWQGGPADIMLRRLVIPDEFDPASDNPYAFENMACTNPDGSSGWVYPADNTSGYAANPNYLKGLCMAPAINISGSTVKTCTVGTGNEQCAAAFPVADDGSIPVDPVGGFPKVLEWRQCDGVAAIEGCENGVDTTGDIDDQSWENPYEVAKGHRGFLYGDMVMMMYAWSPNWQSNAVGNDHYNLYQRRSFDGGVTWTTTPSSMCDAMANCGAGVTALEFNYGATVGEYVPYVWTYAAGAFEQARNLSLLTGNKVTILDPRYSPPGGLKQYATIRTDWLTNNADLIGYSFEDALPYPDDLAIDPSKYYLVYETGDNTTVAEGEAVPLDLFYSRGTVFGDNLEWFDYVNDADDGNPVGGIIDPSVLLTAEPRWPWLENQIDDLSGEASVVLNPGGTFAYNVWNQWREDILPDGHELIYDSDMWFRRLMWLPDDSTLLLNPTAGVYLFGGTMLSINDGDVLTIVANGRDWDNQGEGPSITAWMWFDDRGSILCEVDNAYLTECSQCPVNGCAECVDDNTDRYCDSCQIEYAECEQRVDVRAADMDPGKYHVHVKAMDNDGEWSRVVSTEIIVAYQIYDTYFPLIFK